jgi:hypothetical protein
MTDQTGRDYESSARGEGAWKQAREAIAERNQRAQKAGREQRDAWERQRAEARRTAEARRDARLPTAGARPGDH